MAKPKGSTLARLFEVSDQERQAFFEKIQHRLQKPEQPSSLVFPSETESVSPTETVPHTDFPSSAAAQTGSVPPTISISPIETVPPFETVPHYSSPKRQGSSRTKTVPHVESTSSAAVVSRSELISPTISISHTVSIPPIETVPPFETVPRYSRPKPRQARLAQDGHSRAEQDVYEALWAAGLPETATDTSRTVTMGLGRLSRIARLSENNCRLNIRGLARKLAVEEIHSEVSATGTGKTYRVYSYGDILQRRKAAGMEWVIRTKGVMFVDPRTGREIGSIPPTDRVPPTESVGGRGTETVGEPPTVSVPLYRNFFRNNNEESSSSGVSAVQKALSRYGPADDDAVHLLVSACREADNDATTNEIAYFVQVKGEQLRGRRDIQNLIGMLLKSVPRCFESKMLLNYREAKRGRENEAQRQAQAILDDPQATEQERKWAAEVLIGTS
jgi:hypothetical protein